MWLDGVIGRKPLNRKERMKQIGFVHIEEEKEGRNYTFQMPMGAPLSEATEIAFQVFKSCDKMYREALDKEIAEREKASE